MTDPVAGQDVEAQARALTRPRRASRFAVVVAGFAGATDDPAEALAWLQEWPAASLYVPLRAVEAAREDERSALRAAQAEAERRRVECQTCGKTGGAVLSYQDGAGTTSRWCCPNCVEAAERRAQEALREAIKVCCERHMSLHVGQPYREALECVARAVAHP
jgi:hypothetical protein